VNQYQKGKTNLHLLKQETVSGSGISWASFLQAGCPSCHPTNSITALKANLSRTKIEKNKENNRS